MTESHFALIAEENITAYGYNLQLLRAFDETSCTDNGYYHAKGVYYLFRPFNGKASHLIVNFNGAYSSSINSRVVFRGYDYNIDGADILCICDSLLIKNSEIKLAWYLDLESFNYSKLYYELIQAIIRIRGGYSECIFTGSSGGGLPSIRFAGLFGETALIANPQIYPHKYFYYSTLLESMGKQEIVPLDLESHILIHTPKKIIIFQNRRDKTHLDDHVTPFVDAMTTKDLNKIINLKLFDHDNSLSASPHDLPFPRGKKHSRILCDYINFGNPCIELFADAYFVNGCIFTRSRLAYIEDDSDINKYKFAFYLVKANSIVAQRRYNPYSDASFSLSEIKINYGEDLFVRAFAIKDGVSSGKLIADARIICLTPP